jgi:hypothetical protein
VSAWTTAAHALAVPDARLLYATTTDTFADRWQALHEQFAVFPDPDLPLRTPADQIALDIVIDDDLSDRKLVALRAQASQTDGLVAALGEERFCAWWSRETFVLAPRLATDAAPATGTAV